MREALAAARIAGAAGEIPVGAIILNATGEIIGSGSNSTHASHDPSGHAEIHAIRAASAHSASRILEGCTLVVTLEPCVMCAGAILAARLSRVIFGAWDEKAGAAGSVYDLLRDGRLPHASPEVVGGVHTEECARLLQEFFAGRRKH